VKFCQLIELLQSNFEAIIIKISQHTEREILPLEEDI
jgi:hypothetical protein